MAAGATQKDSVSRDGTPFVSEEALVLIKLAPCFFPPRRNHRSSIYPLYRVDSDERGREKEQRRKETMEICTTKILVDDKIFSCVSFVYLDVLLLLHSSIIARNR